MKPLNKLEAREALIYTLYVYIHRSCKIYITSEYRNIILHQENHQSNPKPFCPKIGQLHLLAPKGMATLIQYIIAYNTAFDLECSPQKLCNQKWLWSLWKLNALPRIIMFLCLACREKLPTRNLLTRRKLVQEASFPLCKDELETILHIFRNFHKVVGIWKSIRTH